MTFFEIITAAIKDFETYGYDSKERLDMWLEKLEKAAKSSMTPPAELEETLRRQFTTMYDRAVNGKQFLKTKNEISAYKLHMIKPKLLAELQRRIMASANLIKYNRQDMIAKTLRRFSGWATSVPPGGSEVDDKKEVKKGVSKALKDLPFEERRVHIDQAHKFIANLKFIKAQDGGAIAAEWNSHWRQEGYDYREDHKQRDEKIYAFRESRAMQMGWINKGAGYIDEMTMPGEEVFCRCSYTYIYSINDLPESMLTKKGKREMIDRKKRRELL